VQLLQLLVPSICQVLIVRKWWQQDGKRRSSSLRSRFHCGQRGTDEQPVPTAKKQSHQHRLCLMLRLQQNRLRRSLLLHPSCHRSCPLPLQQSHHRLSLMLQQNHHRPNVLSLRQSHHRHHHRDAPTRMWQAQRLLVQPNHQHQ